MRKIKCIWVGKLRKKHWQGAAEEYLKKLGRTFPITEIILKDAPGHLEGTAKNEWEGKKILEKIDSQDFPIALDEHGQCITSVKFSKLLTQWTEDPATSPCFIIGGAYGLSKDVLNRCRYTLSLSPMTFPHELARVLLLEQLYRADSIRRGTPYHHI